MQRDREINHYYQPKGWTVLRFWDFEVKKELGRCVKRVVDVLAELGLGYTLTSCDFDGHILTRYPFY